MATSFTLLTPNSNKTASRCLEDDEAKPGMEFVKSSKGRKASTGKGPNQKKQPQRGMGVAQLERLRIQERWKKMTGTTTTQFQFPSDDPVGSTGSSGRNIVPVLQGYGVNPMIINGGNGGLWGWGTTDTAGGVVMMPRVNFGNGGFGGFNAGFQVATGNGVGVVEASKELSSMPNLQHYKPDRCHLCSKKTRYNGENIKVEGGFKKFGQVLPGTTDVLGIKLENNQNIKEEMNGFTPKASRNTIAAAAYAAGQNQIININETVEVSAIHRKGNTMGTGSVVMEYEFFPGKSSRSTFSKEWEILPSVAVGDEASYANPNSNGLDLSLSLKLSSY